MRRIPIVLVLLAVVFACDSLDKPGIENPVVGSETENGGLVAMERVAEGPYLELIVPDCDPVTTALVPPITTFRWQTLPASIDPDSVRWILLSTQWFDDDWTETLDYIRNNPGANEWFSWTSYAAPGDTGTFWTTPPLDFGRYVFAVHGKEADSTAAQDFEFGRNAVRVMVASAMTGPQVTLTSDFVGPVISSSPNTPVWSVDLTAGTPAEFCWTADASSYGGVIVAYRYAWDIVDPEDPAQWDVGFTMYDGSEVCSSARTYFCGAHTFHLEVFDNNGYFTRIPVKINCTPPPMVLSLDPMPGTCPNDLNPGSGDSFRAALLGSATFDVGDVDLSSVALNKVGFAKENVGPGQHKVWDVSRPPDGSLSPDCSPSGPDGFDDLDLKFDMREVAELVGPHSMGAEVSLVLVGLLTDGTPFYAEEQVNIVGLEGDFGAGPFDTGPPPDTEILQVVNEYYVGGQKYVETIDVFDAAPDTVPYNSWLRIDYRGTPSPFITSSCSPLDDNKCITFQKNFTWRSSTVPGAGETVPWGPIPPEDNNLYGVEDSTSMNMGSVEYLVRFRSVDEFGTVDLTPEGVRIFGNLAPTLDDFAIERHDGSLAVDGDSVVWDWWNPANYHGSISDTLEIESPNIWVVKEFLFVIRGTGHDHPKEIDRGGVKSWFYNFTRADDPLFVEPLANSGMWTEAPVVNSLRDTVMLKVKYSYTDDPGGTAAFAALPDWVHQSYDMSIRGRDTGSTQQFNQYMYVDGERARLNRYDTAAMGRQTEEGSMRFHLTIVR
jgi:hypothetical protein